MTRQDCGGAYVKVQLLATRYDLLRPEYTEELGKLLDSLPVVPTAKILEQIEQSPGRPAEELFPVFDTDPIATASLAQVHGAVLPDGDQVVVKVLKPGIGQKVRIDLGFLRFTARLLDVLPVLRGLDVGGPIDELSRTVTDELDLAREAMYTAFLHERMAADPVAHYAPRVYRHVSNGNVLTLERIHGAYLALLESMEPLPYWNFSRFEQEFKRLLSDFLLASRDPDAPLSQKSTGSFLFRALAILRRNRLPVASTSVQLYRTILVADIVILGLYPTIDWRGHLRRFLQDLTGDLIQTTVRDPLSSPYTAYRLAQLPMAVADTLEWAMRRLPDIGRQTMRSLSAGEQLIPYTLRLLRRAATVGILAVLGIAILKPDRDPSSRIGQVVQGIVENPWPVLAAGVLTVLVLNSFLRRMEPP